MSIERDNYVHPGIRFAQNGTRTGDGQGLSVRDYFAGQALAGMDECADAERMAHWAYKIADAMLAERDK